MRSISPARALLLVVATALAGAALDAQPLRPGMLVGRILDAGGGAVANPVVRVSRGAKTFLDEAEEDGDYRIEGLSAGRWHLSIRRAGYRTLVMELEVPRDGLRRDFTLLPFLPSVDSALLAAGWKGVRGVVSDARGIAPLVGAQIRLLGAEASATTDSLGRFAIPLAANRDFVLRVERTGFATRLMTGRTPNLGYSDVEAPLDTIDEIEREYWVWRDLERRLRFATPRAGQVTRTELEATGSPTLGAALEGAPSVAGRGLVVSKGACLFLDGIPRPATTVDAILVSTVEFVEIYPSGTDLTRTLAGRWPANSVCGAGALKGEDARRAAQFVAVWSRLP